jgi:hypothetical protein
VGSRKIELSTSEVMTIGFEPTDAEEMFILVTPVTVPSRIAPRDIENC